MLTIRLCFTDFTRSKPMTIDERPDLWQHPAGSGCPAFMHRGPNLRESRIKALATPVVKGTRGGSMAVHKVTVVIEEDADGFYAFCPELQGCYAQGRSYEEALGNIRDAVRLHIEDRLEAGE